MKRKYTDEDFIKAVPTAQSWGEVFRRLNLSPGGGSQHTMRKLAKKLNLNISHMTGQGWLRGKTHHFAKSVPLDEVLVENSHHGTSALRKRLIKEGVFERKCYGCGNTKWRGLPISLELEHKNGIRKDNRRENLTLLCPNCHAQTETYRGKNVKRLRECGSGGTEYTRHLKCRELVS